MPTYLAKAGNRVTLNFKTSFPIIGDPTVIFKSGDQDVKNNINYTNSSDDDITWTAFYDVDSDDDDGVVTFTISGTDYAGNDRDFSFNTPSPGVTIDTTSPSNFSISSVSSTGGTNAVITSGYYNATNTGIDITIPIANDDSLIYGTVEVLTKTDDDANFSSLQTETINLNNINSDLTISIANSKLTNAVEWVDGNTMVFQAIINDHAGNPTTSTSNTPPLQLIIDTTPPTTTGNTVITSSNSNTNYAKVNDILSFEVEFTESVSWTIASNATLLFKIGNTQKTAVADSDSTTNDKVTFKYEVVAGDTGVVALPSQPVITMLDDDDVIKDDAGNTMTDLALQSLSGSVTVDTTAPTVSNVTSSTADDSYMNGETISIQVVFSETVVVTGTPQLTLETGSNDAIVNYNGTLSKTTVNDDTMNFTYTVSGEDNHTSSDLDYVGTDSLKLNGGTIRDVAGNNAVLTLAVPGETHSLGANKAIIIDTTAPTVSYVTSSTADGSYKDGVDIEIQVVFSETVVVTGTPQLTLETGANDAVVDYSSGSGTNTLIFNYTIAADENSSDLDYNAPDSLKLNGGTIKDVAGNNATRTLATPGASGSLSFNKDIVVDTTAPTVTDVSSNATNATYKIDDVIDINVVFSEVVNVSGVPELTLETGSVNADATATYNSGSGSNTLVFRYTVRENDSSSDLNYKATTSLANAGGSTIRDAALNDATLTLPALTGSDSLSGNKAIVVDGVIPTVSNVTSTKADGSYNANDEIVIQVVFSETVVVTGTPQLTLETGGTDAVVNYNGTLSKTTVNDDTMNFTYTVSGEDNHTSSDLDYVGTDSLKLNGGTIKDVAGNNAVLTLAVPGETHSLGANKAIIIDTTAPTVSYVTSSTANGSYMNGETISIQVVFSETVVVTGTPQLTLETGEGSESDGVVDYSSGSGSNTLIFNYTIAADENSSDLDYNATDSLKLNGGTIKDVAGNNAVLTLAEPGAPGSLGANKAIIIDTTSPTMTITSTTTGVNASGLTTNDETIDLKFETNEVTTNFEVEDIDVSGGSLGPLTDDGSGKVYTATFTPSDDGQCTIDVAANKFTDAAGNGNTAAQQFTWTRDTSQPSMTITADEVNDGDTSNDASLSLTFTSNEATSNFASQDITVNNGLITNFATTNSTVYTATFTPTTDGPCTIDVAAETFTDAYGNQNTAATQFNWTRDTTAPTITNVSLASNNTTITVTFSEAVYNSNSGSGSLEADDFEFALTSSSNGGDATLSNTTPSSISINGTEYTLGISLSGTPDGSETLTVNPVLNSIYDAVGNVASTSQSNNTKLLNDKLAPTASITYSTAGPYKQGDNVTITATFTESLTTTPKIAISGVSSINATHMSGSGTTWIYGYTAPAGNGDETIALSAGTDAADNEVVAAPTSGSTFTVDNTAPTFTTSATFTVAENQTTVGTVQATDLEGTTVSYSIFGNDDDNNKFNIDSSSGALTFKIAPDYENPGSAESSNQYKVTVTASDGRNTATQDITVNVTDVDDDPPIITSPTTFTVAENQTAIGQVIATDPQGASLNYQISGSEIQINSTGGLTFIGGAPDYETKNTYTATVTVSDAAGNPTSQDITVNVLDVKKITLTNFGQGEEVTLTNGKGFLSDDFALSFDFTDLWSSETSGLLEWATPTGVKALTVAKAQNTVNALIAGLAAVIAPASVTYDHLTTNFPNLKDGDNNYYFSTSAQPDNLPDSSSTDQDVKDFILAVLKTTYPHDADTSGQSADSFKLTFTDPEHYLLEINLSSGTKPKRNTDNNYINSAIVTTFSDVDWRLSYCNTAGDINTILHTVLSGTHTTDQNGNITTLNVVPGNFTDGGESGNTTGSIWYPTTLVPNQNTYTTGHLLRNVTSFTVTEQ